MTQQERSHGEARRLEEAADDEPPFSHEQPELARQVGLGNGLVFGDARVGDIVDRNDVHHC